MHRFQALENEINKRIKIDEKSNIVIDGWSPNNVRRLIIGFEYAIVQYHKTGGKYGKLIEIVDMRTHARKDTALTEVSDYISVLDVLVKGRVVSSVEEIIFCKDDTYPNQLFQLDKDSNKLSKANTSIENRFVRLRHISVTNLTVKEMVNFVTETRDSTSLLLDKLKEVGLPLITLVDIHKDDWWRGKALRPKYYHMDKQILSEHFDTVIGKMEQQQKEEMVRKLELDRSKGIITDYTDTTDKVLEMSKHLLEHMNSVFENIPLLSKAEWGSVLQRSVISKEIRKEIKRRDEAYKKTDSKSEGFISDIRRIDFDKIQEMLTNVEGTGESVIRLLWFKHFVFDEVLKGEESYKRESNKHNLSTSIDMIKKLTGFIINHQFSIVFLSLVKNLSRNTPKYADFFYDRIKLDLPQVVYTRPMIEFCNLRLEDGVAKQTMDNIGAQELVVKQFSLDERYKFSNLVLNSVLKGVKPISD